ncbi:MAG: VWA domain-containing protein [Actinobacteria bacterium]|nr:VWA domain-containing protein [Actinomycetota bacterium]
MSDQLIVRLAGRLRARGLPISVAEVIDAHRCVALIGWHDRQRATAALRATLVKHAGNDAVFDDELGALLDELSHLDPAEPRSSDVSSDVGFDGSAPVIGQLPDLAERISVEDQRAESMEQGLAQRAEGSDTGQSIGLDGVDLADAGERAGDDRRWHRLRPSLQARERSEISPSERRQVERAARTFVHRHRHDARRWGPSRLGRLDVRATMRAAQRSSGVPMMLRRRGRIRVAPRVVVLADVSISVRPTAVLALHTADALTRCSRGVRLIAFVDRPVDATSIVRRSAPDVAVDVLLDGGVVDIGAASDYGAALRAIDERAGTRIGRVTTVIVFGDGRSNGADPGFEVVERWMRRAAGLHWCTPEPVGAWPLGFAEMQGYAERVTSASQLRTVADVVAVLTSESPTPSPTPSP